MNKVAHFEDGHSELNLSQEKIVCIDTSDYDLVKSYQWCSLKGTTKLKTIWYATAKVDGVMLTMHRFLMPGVKLVDHRDGDGLNNRRKNLRSSTKSQNGFNCLKRGVTSKYHGVYWNRRLEKWMARIRVGDGKRLYLGVHDSEEAAYQARLTAEQKHFPGFERVRM